MISYLESGKKAMRLENLIRLCHALQVGADYILMGRKSTSSADRTAQKLTYLEPRDFRLVEEVIDNCIALADKKQEA